MSDNKLYAIFICSIAIVVIIVSSVVIYNESKLSPCVKALTLIDDKGLNIELRKELIQKIDTICKDAK